MQGEVENGTREGDRRKIPGDETGTDEEKPIGFER
jgi:hypothetical protein